MSEAVTIKKYANRRLYNMATSTYITLADVAAMVRAGQDFVVVDARTGEDITRSILTQIIVDAESQDGAVLPIPFLRDLISAYGDTSRAMLPTYLEESMRAFQEGHARWMAGLQAAAPQAAPLTELVQRSVAANIDLFGSTLKAFSAFVPGLAPEPVARQARTHPAASGPVDGAASEPADTLAEAAPGAEESIEQMTIRLEELKEQIARRVAQEGRAH